MAAGRTRIDRSTVLGLAILLGLVGGAVVLGGGSHATVFWRAPALALVVGGALAATWIACPQAHPSGMMGVFRSALTVQGRRPEETIVTVVTLADMARRDGLLALEETVAGLEDDFLRRAMQMAIDGTDPQTIEAVCRAEMESTDLRHAEGQTLLESMARFAPAFGMIGTLIGLVLMLERIDDPSQIAPGMAVALLATMYGLLLANVVCIPLARRLTLANSRELLGKTLALRGVLAIQAGDNPRVVAQKLRAYLPAAGRGHEFSYGESRAGFVEERLDVKADAPAEPAGRVNAASGAAPMSEAQAKALAKQLEKMVKARGKLVDAA